MVDLGSMRQLRPEMRRGPEWPRRRGSRLRSRRGGDWLHLALLLGCLGAGCQKTKSTDPQLATAGSLEAQRELRELEEQWELASQVARRELRPELEAFTERYGTDPSVARARIMLGQIALSERRYQAAEEVLAPLVEGRPGTSRDEAIVILAALDNRRGDHERALARLEPLEGKLLSREARDQYARERTSAAMGARKWRLTVDAMTSWLGESQGDATLVKDWIRAAIIEVPPRALSRLLADWPEKESTARDKRAREWIHRVVIEHLAREALRLRDARLATDLLENSPPWLRAGQSGDELSVLASMAQKDAQIVGRSVGVVLDGDSLEQQRRSVRVALGLMRGLRERGGEASVQFLAAENRGSVSAALGLLSSLGASILVAGVEETTAIEALSFAETRQVPVVVMTAPAEPIPGRFGFVFGSSLEREREAVSRAFPDIGRWTTLGTSAEPCAPGLARPQAITFPLFEWREEGTEGVLVVGDSGCATRLSTQLAAAGWEPVVVFGLEASHALPTVDEKSTRLRAGQFPVSRQLALGDEMTDAEESLSSAEGAPRLIPRDWYFTLGVDLAKLVAIALRGLPEGAASDQAEVRKRHERARDALLEARDDLTSSDARGFSPQQVLERTIFVEQAESGGKGEGT